MRVHHLNCATLCPRFRRFVNGDGAPFGAGHLVCHCLLIETDEGLVLVDTGFGLEDYARPVERGHRLAHWLTNARKDPAETAIRQIEALGFSANDVRHIIPTHLDFDHAGGLSDFPHATVHLHATEYDAAMHPQVAKERRRYHRVQWAHDPKWSLYSEHGEPWFGFPTVRALKGLPEEILLVPLMGHTRGHCGVAVRTADGWLLHCGDAYFHRGEIHGGSVPIGLSLFAAAFQIDGPSRVANVARLSMLAKDAHAGVRLFCAHDPEEFQQCQSAGGPAVTMPYGNT